MSAGPLKAADWPPSLLPAAMYGGIITQTAYSIPTGVGKGGVGEAPQKSPPTFQII